MQRYEALNLKELSWSHGREVCLICIRNGIILSNEQMEAMILQDGTSTWDGEWFVCVDGKKSPAEYAKAVIWLDGVLFGLMI